MNPIPDMKNFAAPLTDAARDLAQAACDLDWNKNGFPQHLRIQAIGLARDMHKLADALEAEQASPAPHPNPLPACGERVPEAGEGAGDMAAGPGWAAVTGGLA